MSDLSRDRWGNPVAMAMMPGRAEDINVRDLVDNAMTSRQEWLQRLLDPRRDINKECHYPDAVDISPEEYKQLYDRDAIANRVVSVLPKECWQVSPSVFETEDPDDKTPFEAAWNALEPTTGGVSWYKDEKGGTVWEYLQRVDVLSGIGHFGVLLMGFDDGQNLQTPVDGAMVQNIDGRMYNMPDGFLTKSEEELIRKTLTDNQKLPLNPQEEAVLNQLARQRELTINALRKLKQGPEGQVTGTDKEYSQGFGLGMGDEGNPSLSGTDQQYFGVQFGPTEIPTKQVSKEKRRLLFLRPFDESLVQIVRYEWNINNPRFGMPVMYRITLNDPREQHSGIGLPMATVFVHWSRVIHVNDVHDVAGSSEIFSPPRMRPVLNRILDLQKIYGAAGEGYWQGAFTGVSLETHPQLGGDVTIDSADVRSQLENYMNSLQRWLAITGMSAKTLSPTVTDPVNHVAIQIEAICIQKGIPVRVFKGSERGELASSQDDASWNDRLKARQNGYITPRIIVPFVDRLIGVGVLPEPNTPTENAELILNADNKQVGVKTATGYSVVWPDLDSNTDKDQAQIALVKTQAMAAYVAGNVEAIMPLMDYLTKVLAMTQDEAKQVIESAIDQLDDPEDRITEPPAQPQAGGQEPPGFDEQDSPTDEGQQSEGEEPKAE